MRRGRRLVRPAENPKVIVPARAFPEPDGPKQLSAEIDAFMRERYGAEPLEPPADETP